MKLSNLDPLAAAFRRLSRLCAAALIFIWLAMPSYAANVLFAFTNAFTGLGDTNSFVVTAVSSNIQANGSVITTGFGKRYFPSPDGTTTNSLLQGFYAASSTAVPANFSPIVFAVPNDNSATIYNAFQPPPYGLAVSGFNTYNFGIFTAGAISALATNLFNGNLISASNYLYGLIATNTINTNAVLFIVSNATNTFTSIVSSNPSAFTTPAQVTNIVTSIASTSSVSLVTITNISAYQSLLSANLGSNYTYAVSNTIQTANVAQFIASSNGLLANIQVGSNYFQLQIPSQVNGASNVLWQFSSIASNYLSTNTLGGFILTSNAAFASIASASNLLQSTKQPASLILSNLSVTGANTNPIAAGSNITIATNFGVITITAPNQTQLTNGLSASAFTPLSSFMLTSLLPGLTNQFALVTITNGLASIQYVQNATNGFVGSGITNGLETTAHAAATYYLLTNPSNYITAANVVFNTNQNFLQTTGGIAYNFTLTNSLTLGADSTFLVVNTNVIGVIGADQGLANGTYIQYGGSGNWTNLNNPQWAITLSGSAWSLNLNGVGIYQASGAINSIWTVVPLAGGAFAPQVYYGATLNANGLQIQGFVSSTNITYQITNAIATLAPTTNSILQLIAQYGINPTNGITAATATNISFAQILQVLGPTNGAYFVTNSTRLFIGATGGGNATNLAGTNILGFFPATGIAFVTNANGLYISNTVAAGSGIPTVGGAGSGNFLTNLSTYGTSVFYGTNFIGWLGQTITNNFGYYGNAVGLTNLQAPNLVGQLDPGRLNSQSTSNVIFMENGIGSYLVLNGPVAQLVDSSGDQLTSYGPLGNITLQSSNNIFITAPKISMTGNVTFTSGNGSNLTNNQANILTIGPGTLVSSNQAAAIANSIAGGAGISLLQVSNANVSGTNVFVGNGTGLTNSQANISTIGAGSLVSSNQAAAIAQASVAGGGGATNGIQMLNGFGTNTAIVSGTLAGYAKLTNSLVYQTLNVTNIIGGFAVTNDLWITTSNAVSLDIYNNRPGNIFIVPGAAADGNMGTGGGFNAANGVIIGNQTAATAGHYSTNTFWGTNFFNQPVYIGGTSTNNLAVTANQLLSPNNFGGMTNQNSVGVLSNAGPTALGGPLLVGGSAGTSGYVLQSQGPGVVPTWASGGGGGGLSYLQISNSYSAPQGTNWVANARASVKPSMFGTPGAGDDSILIQAAIDFVAFSNAPAKVVDLGGLTYHCTNTILLRTNAYNSQQFPQYPAYTIAGPGVIVFQNKTNGNGMQFMTTNLTETLAYVTLRDFALLGPMGSGAPSSGNGNTSLVNGYGIFIGFGPTNWYVGNTAAYGCVLQNLDVEGWKVDIGFTNTVGTELKNCIAENSWLYAIDACKCDTFRMYGGYFGGKLNGTSTYPMAALHFGGQTASNNVVIGSVGGILVSGGEWTIGNSILYQDASTPEVSWTGGNWEGPSAACTNFFYFTNCTAQIDLKNFNTLTLTNSAASGFAYFNHTGGGSLSGLRVQTDELVGGPNYFLFQDMSNSAPPILLDAQVQNYNNFNYFSTSPSAGMYQGWINPGGQNRQGNLALNGFTGLFDVDPKLIVGILPNDPGILPASIVIFSDGVNYLHYTPPGQAGYHAIGNTFQSLNSTFSQYRPISFQANQIVFDSQGLTTEIAQFFGITNGDAEINVQNTSSGTNSSTSITATANDGSASSHYMTMGKNGQNYTNINFWGGPHDGYLFTQGTADNSAGVNQGNLIIGTGNTNTGVYFSIGQGGSTNYQLIISSNGLNLVSGTIIGLGFTNAVNAQVTNDTIQPSTITLSQVAGPMVSTNGSIFDVTFNGNLLTNIPPSALTIAPWTNNPTATTSALTNTGTLGLSGAAFIGGPLNASGITNTGVLMQTGTTTNSGAFYYGSGLSTANIVSILGIDNTGKVATNLLNSIAASVNHTGIVTNTAAMYPGAGMGASAAVTDVGLDATGRAVTNSVRNLGLNYVRDIDVSTGPVTLAAGNNFFTLNSAGRTTISALMASSPQMCPAGALLTNLTILAYSPQNIGTTNVAVYGWTNGVVMGSAFCTLVGGAATSAGTNTSTTTWALSGLTNTFSLCLSNPQTGTLGTNCYSIGLRFQLK